MVSKDARVERVLALIQRDLTTHWTRRDFARHACLSESQLCRLFKQELGLSLAAYFRQQRLGRAAERLRETRRSVKEIGSMVGFASPSHFDRCFKAFYGRAPAKYRAGCTAPE